MIDRQIDLPRREHKPTIPATCQGQIGCLEKPQVRVLKGDGTTEYPCLQHIPRNAIRTTLLDALDHPDTAE